jgi:agmatinase
MGENQIYEAGNKFTQGGYRDGNLITTDDVRRFSGVPTFLKAPLLESHNNPTVGIIGVPFDGCTVRTPGSRFGAREIRNYSWRVNEYNSELSVNPYEIHNIVDCGDILLSPLNIQNSFESIELGIQKLLERDILPISVGGDHFITHPILRAIHNAHGKVAVIDFDSHSDTADEVYGQKLNHGTMFRRAIEEDLIIADKLIQVGIRKLFHDGELDYHKEQGIQLITSRDLKKMGANIRNQLKEQFARLKGYSVYVTFDIDFVDPAYAPGTGSPEVGGPTSDEALECVRALKGLNIVGFDLVEVSPPYDLRDLTCLLAVQVLYEMVSVLAPTRK